MQNSEAFLRGMLDEQTRVLQSNARLAIVWGLGLFVVGLVATVVLYNLPATQSLQDVAKIGPILITAAISSIQFKTIAVSRERVATLRNLRDGVSGLHQLPPEQGEKIFDMIIEVIKDFAKR